VKIVNMINSIRIDKATPIEMRDGVILRGDIYRPDDKKKHPAILIRTPYSRPESLSLIFMDLTETVMAGYALILQNVRGTYASGGETILGAVSFDKEGFDGYDSVEWIAGQPWCDGNVGMTGGSYLGLVQWLVAKENPPHLKAISPAVASRGSADPNRDNGVLHIASALTWIMGRLSEILDKQEKEGKDVFEARRMLRRAVDNPEEVYNFLPLKEIPHFNFEGLREFWVNRVFNTSLETPEYAEKVRTPYEKIMVPCFQVSGWFDDSPSGTFRHFLNMKERGGTSFARESQHILMGPWNHFGPSAGDPSVGDIGFGTLADVYGSRLGQYYIDFFNKYLRGMDVDLPAVRYFVMGKNVWRDAAVWPPLETRWQRFFLHSKGHANTSGGDGQLSRDEPGKETPDVFLYNPHHPVPTIGCWLYCQLGTVAPGVQEQSPIERRDDVLCYATPELKEDLEVTGPLELHLFAATSARDTDFVAKLVDIWPDGRSFNVTTDGIIRARYRKSLYTPELVIPEEVNEYVINLQAVSQVFRKGHRLQIDVTSSSFPQYDRNMNTGNPIGEDAKGIMARQTIYHQREYASFIDLSVIKSP
jgi:putative CocE/NonD family hydrolase